MDTSQTVIAECFRGPANLTMVSTVESPLKACRNDELLYVGERNLMASLGSQLHAKYPAAARSLCSTRDWAT